MILAIIVILVFISIIFHEVLFGGLLFWSDTHMSFEPLFAQLGEALSSGQSLWSSLLETGKPILANPTQASFYPPNLLFALAPAHKLITVLNLLHVVLGSIGVFFLARRIELRTGEALVSALLFAGGGAGLSSTPYHGLTWCTAWLPWLLVCFDRVSRRERTLFSTAALSLTTFMMLTITEPFVLIAGMLGVFTWMTARLFNDDGAWRDRCGQHVLIPIAGATAAAVLASPYIVAVAFNLPLSVRGLGFEWEGITIWSLHPIRLIEAMAPGIFGFLGQADGGAFWATGLTPDKGFPLLPSLYVGAPALALAVAGIWKSWPHRNGLIIWLGVLILFAIGSWMPFYGLLEGIPGFDAARFPVKWLVPAMVPFSLLVGAGLKNAFGTGDSKCRRAFIATLTALALTLVSLTVLVHFSWFTDLIERFAMKPHMVFDQPIRAVVVSSCMRGLIAALGAVLVMLIDHKYRLRSPIVLSAMLLVVFVDLTTANTRLITTTVSDFFTREPEALQIIRSDPEGFQRIRVDEPTTGASWLASGNPSLLDISLYQTEILAGYVAARHRVPTALTLDTEATGPARVLFLKVLAETAPVREQAMVYGSASITHLVTDREIDDPVFHSLDSIRTIAGTRFHVYRNSLAQPRVRMVGYVIPYSGDDGYRRVLLGSSPDLFNQAVLIDTEDLQRAPSGIEDLVLAGSQPSSAPLNRVRLIEDRGHRLTINATTDEPAVLVISDAYLPQWRAKVNAVDVPILRVNYCFRGILLGEGDHTVVLDYNPWRL